MMKIMGIMATRVSFIFRSTVNKVGIASLIELSTK
jgi:hypothetical protein